MSRLSYARLAKQACADWAAARLNVSLAASDSTRCLCTKATMNCDGLHGLLRYQCSPKDFTQRSWQGNSAQVDCMHTYTVTVQLATLTDRFASVIPPRLTVMPKPSQVHPANLQVHFAYAGRGSLFVVILVLYLAKLLLHPCGSCYLHHVQPLQEETWQ